MSETIDNAIALKVKTGGDTKDLLETARTLTGLKARTTAFNTSSNAFPDRAEAPASAPVRSAAAIVPASKAPAARDNMTVPYPHEGMTPNEVVGYRFPVR